MSLIIRGYLPTYFRHCPAIHFMDKSILFACDLDNVTNIEEMLHERPCTRSGSVANNNVNNNVDVVVTLTIVPAFFVSFQYDLLVTMSHSLSFVASFLLL